MNIVGVQGFDSLFPHAHRAFMCSVCRCECSARMLHMHAAYIHVQSRLFEWVRVCVCFCCSSFFPPRSARGGREWGGEAKKRREREGRGREDVQPMGAGGMQGRQIEGKGEGTAGLCGTAGGSRTGSAASSA